MTSIAHTKGSQCFQLGYIHMDSWVEDDGLWPDYWFEEADNLKDKNIDADEVILPANKTFNLVLTYPLRTPYVEEIQTGKKGLTRIQIIAAVISAYKRVYQIEDGTTTIPAQLGKDAGYGIPYNRVSTDGEYGIWGHELGDLILHTLYVKGNQIEISCDS